MIHYFNFSFTIVIKVLLLIMPVLVNVAFVTLMERKILGLSQNRLGPNKVAFNGLIQPFRDAIKLFIKQSEPNTNVNWKFFLLGPFLILIVALFLWVVFPSSSSHSSFPLGLISLLTFLSLSVYPLLIIGWASNRKYALIGAIRGVAQTISYEISLGLIIIVFIVYYIGLAASSRVIYDFRLLFYWPSLAILWIIILLAETNRTPFDFSEGESELVSGFNVEYSATGFVLIFLREYAIIILFSCLRVSLFCGLELFIFFSRLLGLIVSSFWFLLRATLPRYRYDLLINLAWKRYLPIVLLVTIVSTLVFML